MTVTTDKLDEIGYRNRHLDWIEEIIVDQWGKKEYIYHWYYFEFYDLDKSGARGEELADACYRDLYYVICNKYLITEEGNSYWDDFVFALIQSTSGYDVFYSGRYNTGLMRSRLSATLGMSASNLEVLTSRRYYNKAEAENGKKITFLTMVYRGREGRRDGSIGGIRRS